MSSSAAFTRSYDQSHTARHHSLFSLMGAIPAAFFITIGLLYIMFLLVRKDFPVIVPKPVPVIPNVVAEFPKKIPTFEDPLPVKPVEQNQPPVIRNNEQVDVDPEPGINILDPIVVVKPPIDGGVGVSGQMVPFIKIAPQYPQNAAAKGIEGYVDVMFDVTPLGTTDNIRIIAYVPSTIFNKSVIKAIKGWKYKPNTVDGIAVKTFDVKDRVRFTMEK